MIMRFAAGLLRLRRSIGALVLGGALGLLAATPTQADNPLEGWEVRGGVLAHDAGLFSGPEESGIDLNLQLILRSPQWLAWAGKPRPHFGGSYATDGISQVYGGLTWDWDLGSSPFYLSGEFGGAIHDADDLDPPNGREEDGERYLGCRVLFRLAGGLGYNITDRANIQLYADHISNATLCSSNEGLENAGVRFGYKF